MISYEVLLWRLLRDTVNTSYKLQNVNINKRIAILTISFTSFGAYTLKGENFCFPCRRGTAYQSNNSHPLGLVY